MGVPPFQEFLDATGSVVHRFLRAAVGPDAADDVFQETFLAALRAYPRLDHGDRLDRWVLRIASRKAVDHHRGVARRPVVTDRVPEPAANPAPDVDDELWSAVASLPPRQRIAVVHRHVLDRSYAEIGELMGSTEQTARANVYQGLERLRRVIG